jgi:LacI family transcriptional regulator
VQVPKYEIGKVAAQLINDYLEGRYSSLHKVLLPSTLIVRESSVYDRTNRTND